MFKKYFHLSILAFGFLGLVVPGWSEEAGATVNSGASVRESRLNDLEQKIIALQQAREKENEIKPAKNEKETALPYAGSEGFGLKSGDGSFALKFSGLFQSDSRSYLAAVKTQAADTFLLRRARPILEGTVASQFDFKLVPDFGGGTAVVQEAYVECKTLPFALLRAGRFKSPVGLERLQSSASTVFTETALPTNLVPNFDLGFQLGGSLTEGSFNYQIALLNGAADGASWDMDNQHSKDAVVRVFLLPFRPTGWSLLKGLGFGAGWSYGGTVGSAANPALPVYKTSGQQTFFSYRSDGTNTGTAVAYGDLRRLVPQASYYCGPLGLLGEYAATLQPVKIGATTRTLRNEGWQATASLVLTGENASYNNLTPLHPFNPGAGTWGAWEITGRFNRLIVDSQAFPLFADPAKSARSARAWACGLNGYLSRNVKLTADYEQTVFELGAANSNRENESVISTRVQFTY